MKILMCYPHAIYGGGSSYYFRSLVKELSKKNDVTVLIPDSDKYSTNVKKYNWKIPFKVLGSSNTFWPETKQYRELTSEERKTYDDDIYKSLEEVILIVKPDVINVHFLLPSAYVAIKIKLKYNIPVIVTSHGADVKINETIDYYLETSKYFLQFVDQVIAVSPAHQKWITDVFPILKGKVSIISGGADASIVTNTKQCQSILNKFKLLNKQFILAVGRFEERKGFMLIPEIAIYFPSIQFVLV